MTRLGFGVFLALGFLASLPFSATAGPRWQKAESGDVVVAHSRHGNGSVSGRVRSARKGLEVRLPGGSWVGCRRSCSETLRVKTVDLFENQGSMRGYGTMANECGIFGCLDLDMRWR
jgi:hypothetical protein